METLLTRRSVGPLDNFHSHKGKVFAAVVKLTPEHTATFDFGSASAEGAGGAPPDFSAQTPVGKCPVCGAGVYEHGASYVCEKTVGEPRSCSFRSGAVILKQAVDRAQMTKLLATGRTDLLTRFISKKGRPFRAFLVVRDGAVGFEFVKAGPKKTGPAAARAAPRPAAVPAVQPGSPSPTPPGPTA